MTAWALGIDIGGTFTDVVALDYARGRLHSHKVLTTHGDPADGVVAGVRHLIELAQISPGQIERVVHATTLFTNALIERRGARTALLTNRGFRDVLEMGNERKYDLYDLAIERAPALVPRQLRAEVVGRLTAQGAEIEPLDPDDVRKVVTSLIGQGVESLAVSLLHAYASARHERQIGAWLGEWFPDLDVTLSCDVAPVIREYERMSTTVANAYIKPMASRYLAALQARLSVLGLRDDVLMMLSNGGLTHLEQARRRPIELLESGPAAGAIAAAHYGAQDGVSQLLAFDMGGTTAKLSLIEQGQPAIAYGFEAARRKRFAEGSGLPVRITTVDLIEIGAGGGSIAHLDALGLLKVGPQSAGSEPGPACYPRGGNDPTVTDANLLLGYLNPDYFAAGTLVIDRDRAEAAVSRIGDRIERSALESAWGIHDIVAENMASAARVHIAERGRDPSDFVLLCTGGGGPLHGYGVARKIGVKTLMCPPAAGVASAYGLLMASTRIDRARTVSLRPGTDPLSLLEQTFAELESEAGAALGGLSEHFGPVRLSRQADGRFVGQAFHLTVTLPDGPYDTSPASEEQMRSRLNEAFVSGYREKFGRTPPHVPVELVTLRVSAIAPPRKPFVPEPLAAGRQATVVTHRPVYFHEAGTYVDTPIYHRSALQAGFTADGPLIIEDESASLVIGPSGRVVQWPSGNLVVTLDGSLA